MIPMKQEDHLSFMLLKLGYEYPQFSLVERQWQSLLEVTGNQSTFSSRVSLFGD